MYKFNYNDVIRNTLVGHPEVSFKIYRNKIFYNNLKLTTKVDDGYAHIFDNNLSSSYAFIYKSSDNNNFSSVEYGSYVDSYNNGGEIKINYPRSSSISVNYLDFPHSAASQLTMSAMKNTLNYYNIKSPYYDFSYYENKNLALINIPAIIYGSYIEQGTVSLKFYYTGSLLGELQDTKKNGELVQVFPTSTVNGYGSTAGVVLYNEGIILLSGSWTLNSSIFENYIGSPANPKWIYWGKSLSQALVGSSSYDLNFRGTTKINTITMFAIAPKSELNYSNNPTFLDKNKSTGSVISSSNIYKEYAYREIKNTVSTNYSGYAESYKPQVFINKIHIYDKDKKLIAIAKTATPVKKTEDRAITFKLKLDT